MTPLTLFKLLADETRLLSVLLIAEQGELCVCELTCALQQIQPKISRHLAMLRKAQLLLDRRQGQWVYYRLNPLLPDWALSVINHTRQQNPAVLAPLQQNLCAMGERPAREASCCA
ncbi:MAG: metalloregulator ArsR/SmtB family transcription factor [Gammaproteobacteria bacterium]|nr:metalloregulator ArsR/SmtB family transcription factor [Gammaproteobacteria bacterium]MBU2182703.1 metalloregulator ArsR/SmtB family transcription factor [Gammaproteobacteria bacterium]